MIATAKTSLRVAVIGAGPAGLMAAEVLARAGVYATVFEAKATVGRKFLMAGRGGLNLTHSEPADAFLARYGAAAGAIAPMLQRFPPSSLVEWAQSLGQETFIGTSGRIFPRALKASPLLRAWLARLDALGVQISTRRRWTGWSHDGALVFNAADGAEHRVHANATILALGGASWPKLGSDGAWTHILAERGVPLAPFEPANCGFVVGWTEVFSSRFAGSPLKGVSVASGATVARGEAMISSYGLEGGVIYALSKVIRDIITTDGAATVKIDLRPDMTAILVAEKLARMRSGETLTNRLRRTLGLAPAAIGLLREAYGVQLPTDAAGLAHCMKAVPLMLREPASLDRAISTAGGVMFEAVDEALQLRAAPGVFVAGEMLDWEAPTGGYLMQASFATGVAAARGALAYLA